MKFSTDTCDITMAVTTPKSWFHNMFFFLMGIFGVILGYVSLFYISHLKLSHKVLCKYFWYYSEDKKNKVKPFNVSFCCVPLWNVVGPILGYVAQYFGTMKSFLMNFCAYNLGINLMVPLPQKHHLFLAMHLPLNLQTVQAPRF